jgi:hypothetical protein
MEKAYMQVLCAPYDEISIVMKEFNVTEKMMDESIQMLKDWFKHQPHLCNIRLGNDSEKQLMWFSIL